MKVQIEDPVLRGLPHDWVLQRVASVYSDREGYHVYAPAAAKGAALDWVEHFLVRQISESGEGENDVDEQCRARIVSQVKEQLEKLKLSADIWSLGNQNGRYYAAQICLRGHVHSSDGKAGLSSGGLRPWEHCEECGNANITACPHCEAPIRGQGVYLTSAYVRPSFCYTCARPYPWTQDRLQTARELLYHDDKLTEEDREKLWSLLKDVMSSPKDDLAPAKRKLIDINLGKAGQVTRDIITDLIAKTIAEIVRP